MAEHLLIADIGALLLVLGPDRTVLAPLLRSALALAALWRHPVAALPCGRSTSASGTCRCSTRAAVSNDGVHALEHILFVACGIGDVDGAARPLPKPAWFGNLARLGYVVAVRLIGTVLANVCSGRTTDALPRYAPPAAPLGISRRTTRSSPARS